MRLRALIEEKNLRFRQRFLDRELPAVTLQARPDAPTRALSDNFLELQLDRQVPANQNVQVLVTGVSETGLSGRLIA